MNKNLITLLLIVLSFNSYSQITFERGYIIQNTGNKKTCLIKNIDWRDNPTEIKYKLLETDKVKTVKLNNIIEFGIDNYSKYIRTTIDIDRSPEDLNNISENRNPNFNKETLFLKVLVEGKASLYEYTDSNLNRYFFRLNNLPIKQLIYKSFRTSDNGIRKNEDYKQQLINNLECSDISLDKIKTLVYKQKKLINIFVNYNQCTNSNFINFKEETKRGLFNLSVRLGLNSSSLSLQKNGSTLENRDFNNKLGMRVSVEAEFILPFNKNKWGIIIEPTYQYYKSKKDVEVSYLSGGRLFSSVDYKSIEVPVGIRYYLFLKNKSKLFINASLIFDLSLNSTVEFNREDGSTINLLEINTGNNLAFGFGYNYNKYSLELRAQTPRVVLGNYISWSSSYKTLSIIVGYNIF
ncbi:MAG: autotransporter outer membrane beta-barrel domain-containing protein [Flavobacteriaceae bacterium]|nr:autotransporter outer membrane beta-barrel domain-containing protein [Flavobacteriaceae bacterium]